MIKATIMIKAATDVMTFSIITSLYFSILGALGIVCALCAPESSMFSWNIYSLFPYIFFFGTALVMAVATLYRAETKAFVEIVDIITNKIGTDIDINMFLDSVLLVSFSVSMVSIIMLTSNIVNKECYYMSTVYLLIFVITTIIGVLSIVKRIRILIEEKERLNAIKTI